MGQRTRELGGTTERVELDGFIHESSKNKFYESIISLHARSNVRRRELVRCAQRQEC